MKNLTTNENILFQVAFKEACMFAREVDGTLCDRVSILQDSLDLYKEVLIKGLTQLSEEKENSIEDHIKTLSKLKTIEEFKVYQNKNAISLKNLSKTAKESLKDFCKKHFNIN